MSSERNGVSAILKLCVFLVFREPWSKCPCMRRKIDKRDASLGDGRERALMPRSQHSQRLDLRFLGTSSPVAVVATTTRVAHVTCATWPLAITIHLGERPRIARLGSTSVEDGDVRHCGHGSSTYEFQRRGFQRHLTALSHRILSEVRNVQGATLEQFVLNSRRTKFC